MDSVRELIEWSNTNPVAAAFGGLLFLTVVSGVKMILVPVMKKQEILLYARRAERAGFGAEFADEMNYVIAARPSSAHLAAGPLYMRLFQSRHQQSNGSAGDAVRSVCRKKVLHFSKRK